MAANEGPRKVLPTPEIHDPVRTPLELVCGSCGQTGRYSVGRIYLDPTLAPKEDPEWLNKSFCFTAYFHCKHCQAGGPWELTEAAKKLLMTLLVEARLDPRRARIHVAHMTTFDGTAPRWATQGEAHLKQLIEKDPDNYFLWSRLGNLYVIGGAPDLALEAFHQAVERNEHDVESLHSIAQVHEERQEDETAARYYHQVLLHARHAPVITPRDMVRNVVQDALETLADLHLRSGKRIPFLPEQPMPPEPGPEQKSAKEVVIRLSQYDLSNDRDMSRLVDWWVTGKPPVSAPPAKPASTWSPKPASQQTQRVGRNDPCPCRSGKGLVQNLPFSGNSPRRGVTSAQREQSHGAGPCDRLR